MDEYSDDSIRYEILDRLEKHFSGSNVSTVQPGDITYEDIMNKFSLSYDTTRHKMKELIRAGLYTKHRVKIEGKSCVIFREVKQGTG
jgi:hypothetical protein